MLTTGFTNGMNTILMREHKRLSKMQGKGIHVSKQMGKSIAGGKTMIHQRFEMAKEQYEAFGVDVQSALRAMDETPISLHCWQGDDVLGFEGGGSLTGGIQTTGNYPGRARNIDELRADLSCVLSMVPGPSKINLHANYLDSAAPVSRDALEPKHFASWAEWAVEKGVGLDFNSTFFSHPLGENGSLTSPDEGIRAYWIEHARRCRRIAAYFGERTGQTCVTNHWIHDGEKEIPIDTMGPRLRLIDSLDQVFAEKIDKRLARDAVESKLFGIGSEAYVPGSHEFYLGYALTRPDILLTMDAGHYHPTEVISGKISAVLCFVEKVLLHVSRPVRWDSDHVVLLDDETRQIMREVVRAGALRRVYLALDYFDASINRVIAWTTGARNAKKALLAALLEPTELLKRMEQEGDKSGRLALQQELLTLPMGAVWDWYCEQSNVPVGYKWVETAKKYEQEVFSKR